MWLQLCLLFITYDIIQIVTNENNKLKANQVQINSVVMQETEIKEKKDKPDFTTFITHKETFSSCK